MGDAIFLWPGLGSHIAFSAVKVKMKVAQHTVHGVLQARIPEGIAVPFSTGSSHPRDRTSSPTLQADSLPAEPSGSTFPFLLSSVLLAVGLTFYSLDLSPAHTHTEVNYTLLVEERSIILNFYCCFNKWQAYFILPRFEDTEFFFFWQIEGLWQPCIRLVYRRQFSNASAHFVCMSHFGSLVIFLTFSLLLYLSCLYMISDLWYQHCTGLVLPGTAPI